MTGPIKRALRALRVRRHGRPCALCSTSTLPRELFAGSCPNCTADTLEWLAGVPGVTVCMSEETARSLALFRRMNREARP